MKVVHITPDPEKVILYCARVSSDQSNTDVGLIRYLVAHGHWSPFEMAHACVEIETSRAISAQLLRHRSFSFQEFSQRYATVAPGREQAAQNRQSSTDTLDLDTRAWWDSQQRRVNRDSQHVYQEAIKRGVARECARMVLPLSTSTRLYMAGTVRSWIHYIQLRTTDDTQLEHREIAEGVQALLAPEMPTVAAALGWKENQ